MKTIAGKEMHVTVAFRIPFSDYERVLAQARLRGVKRLSKVLRPMLSAGLDVVEKEEVKKNEGST